MGTVAAFQTEFKRISNCVIGLPTMALLNCFISGLRPDIQRELAIHHPTTLHETYGLAKLIEDKLAANHQASPQPPYVPHQPTSLSKSTSTSPGLLPPPTATSATLTVRRLSPSELQTRRAQGLCFRCPEKFHPGHRCNSPQFLIQSTDEFVPDSLSYTEDNSMAIPPSIDNNHFLALSPSALHGTTSPGQYSGGL